MYEISDEECVAPAMGPTSEEPVEDLAHPEEIPQPKAIERSSNWVTIWIKEKILQDCWMNWDDLRRAHQQHEVAQGVLSWRLLPHEVMVGCLPMKRR